MLIFYWLLIINTLFVEQTFRQYKSTSLPKISAKIVLCGGDFQSRARQGKRSSFTDVHFGTWLKTNLCRFCSLKTKFFFVIPYLCWTVCVFHSMNLEKLKVIYASLFNFRDFRLCHVMILKTLKQAKTAERNSTTVECIFHQLAVKNVNVNVVKTIYCQHNSIFLKQKKLIVFIIWPARVWPG